MDLARKLALKGGAIEIVGAPPELHLDVGSSPGPDRGVLVFVRGQSDLRRQQSRIVRSAREDRLTWVAYPKAGQLGTDLKRDSLAALLVPEGVEPVTQISLDDIWSALRFRPSSRP